MRIELHKANLEPNTIVNKHIIAKFRILYKLEAQQRNLPYSGSGLLKKAIRFITNAYKDTLEPSGSLYVDRLLEIAIIVAVKFRLGPNAIVAILLDPQT
jgi:(p)ppGpp synthase/HD superfamily hydrolase